MNGHLEGVPQPQLDLITMVINHLLTGMILQVPTDPGPSKLRDRAIRCPQVFSGSVRSVGPVGPISWKRFEPRRKPSYFPLYWLVNRDPYFMIYEIIPI